MHEIRTQGPVEAVMEVYTDFFMYASGVYQVQMMTMSVMSKKMMMMRMIMLMMIIITVMEFMFRLCKKLLPPIYCVPRAYIAENKPCPWSGCWISCSQDHRMGPGGTDKHVTNSLDT